MYLATRDTAVDNYVMKDKLNSDGHQFHQHQQNGIVSTKHVSQIIDRCAFPILKYLPTKVPELRL